VTRTIRVTVNGRDHERTVEPRQTLADFLREDLELTGTHVGCEHGVCGACTVWLDGEPVRSCSFPVSAAAGKRVVTIEGLAPRGRVHPVQKAWIDHEVPQCGYCQGGQILVAAALLKKNPDPSDKDIDEAMTNICRCGTYARIRSAIHAAAKSMKSAKA